MRARGRRAVARWAMRPLSVALLALALAGCAVQTAQLRAHLPADLAPAVELDATPFFPQTDKLCGPASLATALGAIGIDAAPAELSGRMFLPAREGTLQTEMLGAARQSGAVPTVLPGDLSAVLREVQAGHPVVVLQNLGLAIAPTWHYAVVVGYDLPAGEIVLRSGTTRRERMAMRTFEHTWARSEHWAIAVLAPGQWPVTAHTASVVDASVGFERVAAPALAARVYRSALQRWPQEPTLAIGLGNALHASGDRAGAAEVFRAAAQRHRSAPAWINLASTLLDLGQPVQALQAAEEALRLDDPAWRAQADAVREQVRRALR